MCPVRSVTYVSGRSSIYAVILILSTYCAFAQKAICQKSGRPDIDTVRAFRSSLPLLSPTGGRQSSG